MCSFSFLVIHVSGTMNFRSFLHDIEGCRRLENFFAQSVYIPLHRGRCPYICQIPSLDVYINQKIEKINR